MKRTLILATILTLPALGMAEDKTLPERASDAAKSVEHGTKEAANAVVNATRNAWNSTKAYVTQDPAEFREGAERKLKELAEDIDQLKSESKGELASREYFGTRVKALREHLGFAQNELRKFPEDKNKFPDARKRLNNTLDGLEGAVGEAQKEARIGK
jgi:predicted nuclease with TOPRIM domain